MNRRLLTFAAGKLRSLGAAPVLLALTILTAGFAPLAAAQTTVPHAAAPAHSKAADAPAPVKAYGSPSAPITMEVFSDYECPSCRNLFEQTLRPLKPEGWVLGLELDRPIERIERARRILERHRDAATGEPAARESRMPRGEPPARIARGTPVLRLNQAQHLAMPGRRGWVHQRRLRRGGNTEAAMPGM